MRGQGIAFSTIVTGALALLVLFIVGYIVISGASAFTGGLPKQVKIFTDKCKSYCEELQASAASSSTGAVSIDDVVNSGFCMDYINTKKLDGLIRNHCYNESVKDVVRVSCDLLIINPADGEIYECGPNADWKSICSGNVNDLSAVGCTRVS